jgi:hypothetical protein
MTYQGKTYKEFIKDCMWYLLKADGRSNQDVFRMSDVELATMYHNQFGVSKEKMLADIKKSLEV